MRAVLGRFWLWLALLAVWPPGCLGGQTGDPTVTRGCGGPSARSILMDHQGEYEAPAVLGPTPDACVDADTVVHLEVGADLGERRESLCGVAQVLVEVRVSSGDGLEHSFRGWLDALGGIEPAEGERLDPSAEWDGTLSVSPDDGTVSLSSPTLSTLPSCCPGVEAVDVARALAAGGAAGAGGSDCP